MSEEAPQRSFLINNASGFQEDAEATVRAYLKANGSISLTTEPIKYKDKFEDTLRTGSIDFYHLKGLSIMVSNSVEHPIGSHAKSYLCVELVGSESERTRHAEKLERIVVKDQSRWLYQPSNPQKVTSNP